MGTQEDGDTQDRRECQAWTAWTGEKEVKDTAEKTAAIVRMAPLAYPGILGKPGEMDFLESRVFQD